MKFLLLLFLLPLDMQQAFAARHSCLPGDTLSQCLAKAGAPVDTVEKGLVGETVLRYQEVEYLFKDGVLIKSEGVERQINPLVPHKHSKPFAPIKSGLLPIKPDQKVIDSMIDELQEEEAEEPGSPQQS